MQRSFLIIHFNGIDNNQGTTVHFDDCGTDQQVWDNITAWAEEENMDLGAIQAIIETTGAPPFRMGDEDVDGDNSPPLFVEDF